LQGALFEKLFLRRLNWLAGRYKWAYKCFVASLTIYLDEETLRSVEAAAKKNQKSVSGWAREHLREAATPNKGWPEGYFETIRAWEASDIEDPGEVAEPLDEIVLGSREMEESK
jgi:hypothetical protein